MYDILTYRDLYVYVCVGLYEAYMCTPKSAMYGKKRGHFVPTYQYSRFFGGEFKAWMCDTLNEHFNVCKRPRSFDVICHSPN